MLDVKSFAIGIIMLAVAFGIGRWTAPIPEPEVTDTTVITELQESVEYWQDIAEEYRDSVRVELEIPEPETLVVADGLQTYNVPYRDSLIVANIETTVEGRLDNMVLEYYLRRQLVTEKTNTVYETRVIDRTVTVTPPEQRFEHSIEAGLKYTENFNQGFYAEYRPQLRFGGVNLVGTAHVSNNSYLTVGVKFDL